VPKAEQLELCQNMINNFIRKNLKISDCRLYLPPENGGVGFFCIKDFLDAQRCTWLFRAKKLCNDNWRHDLHALAPNQDPLLIRSSDINKNVNPVLYGIVESYERFYCFFSGQGRNYRQSFIFENSIFKDPASGMCITKLFFGNNTYDRCKNVIRSLTYDACHNNLGFKTIANFSQEGLHLNLAQWMRLRNICLVTKRNMARINIDNNTCFRIDYLVRVWKKGGKKIRKFFGLERERENKILGSRCYNTFCNLVNINLEREEHVILPVWGSSWNIFSYTNDFKNFVFCLRYNQLPLNNRLNSYMSDVNPSCTFCVINGVNPAPRDSLSHCFLHCNTVRNWLENILGNTSFNLDINNPDFFRLSRFGIYNTETLTTSRINVFNLFFDSFKYVVFKHR
jgi:hypothetical protein